MITPDIAPYRLAGLGCACPAGVCDCNSLGFTVVNPAAANMQIALNRFARWLRLTLLVEDGDIGSKTFTFTRQIVAAFITGNLWAAYFGPSGPAGPLSLAMDGALIDQTKTEVDAYADAMGIDNTFATPEQKTAMTSAIKTSNTATDAAHRVSATVVAGGYSLKALGVGVLAVAGIAGIAWAVTK